MTPVKLLAPIAVLLVLVSTPAQPPLEKAPHPSPAPPSANQAVKRRYDVQLAYTGYTGLAEAAPCDVKVNALGYDSLVGSVEGIEPARATDEDVLYTGTVKRMTAIDYCQSRPKSSAPDELIWCVATLSGSAAMDIEITVHGDAGAGAYLKARPVIRPQQSHTVAGTCTTADMNEIRQDYPGGGSGGSPDGQPIASNAAFVLNGIPRLRMGYFPPKRPETAWGLRVTRMVP